MSVHSSVLRRTIGLAAVSTIVVGSLGLAGTARADTSVFNDAKGDMSGHGADIHRVRVVNQKVVRINITHDNLVRSFRSGSSGAVYIDTVPARKGPEFVFVGGFFEGTDYTLARANGWKVGTAALPSPCSYRMSLDYADDVTRIRIGRGCLDRPGKVRVSVRTAGYQGDATVRDWLDGRRQFQPWVKRG